MKIRQLIAGGAVLFSVLFGATPTYADSNVYKVAYIYPEVLIVRASPSTDAREIDRVYRGQEIEVVEECGDWAKVCLALDSYGYINAYHFAYKTYYADGTVTSTEQIADDYQGYEEDYSYDYDYNYDYDYDYNYDYDYDYNYPSEYSYDDSYYEPTYDYSSYEEPTYSSSAADYNYDTTSSYGEEYTPTTTTEDTTTYTETTTSSTAGQQISASAQQYIGNPYVYGGESLQTGADCSGFTKAVLESNGYSVNGRTAADQAAGGTQISLSEAQAGDLIYYDNGSGVYHIAIYNGDGTVTHSSNSTTGVTVSDMNYSGNAAGAVRYWD